MLSRFHLIALLIALVAIPAAGCGSGSTDNAPEANIPAPQSGTQDPTAASGELQGVAAVESTPSSDADLTPQSEPFPEVIIQTSLGTIKCRLDAEKAPETVDNFLHNYVDRDFYADTVFHYVAPEFIIGGGFTADLQPKETRSPIRNEASNGLKNVRGTIAMSRDPEYINSATSEFFINVVDNPSLDQSDPAEATGYGYCVFGEVIEGMDVVERIAQAPVQTQGDFDNVPVEPVVIEAIQRVK